jgi:hypothetical protein
MKLSIIISALILSGCGSAQLVSTRYKPKKIGTVKLTIPGPAQSGAVHKQANDIMKKFCAPQIPEITGTDSVSEIDGSYSSPHPFLKDSVSYDRREAPLLHFECVDKVDKIDARYGASPNVE